jgi:hypothetical protein
MQWIMKLASSICTLVAAAAAAQIEVAEAAAAAAAVWVSSLVSMLLPARKQRRRC